MLQAFMPTAGNIIYREVEKPVPGKNQVLIKVSKIGICGSDLHVFKGEHPLASAPLVQGHEFSGYVSEKGENVTKVNYGDLVVVQPAIGCGKCKKCKAGLIEQCDDLKFIGSSNTEGGGSEYFLADENQVINLNSGVCPQDAAMIEPLAVAVRCVNRAGDISNKNVIVMGGGTIGNLTAQVAMNKGAKKVVLFDINENRVSIAKKCGIMAYNLNAVEKPDDLIELIFKNKKVEVCFECVGKEDCLNKCIDFLERGGITVIPGVYLNNPNINMSRVQDCEISLVGSLMYSWEDFYQAVDIVKRHDVVLSELQTHSVSFMEWAKGYEILLKKDSDAFKVMVDFDITK